jgi:hypothetical protein
VDKTMGEEMFAEILFPKATALQAERVEAVETKVVIELMAVTPTAVCPQCQRESRRPHSYYYRFPADLPLAARPVTGAIAAILIK